MKRRLLIIVMILLMALPSVVRAEDVTLKWGKSPSKDVIGYNIYYKSGASGPPYEIRINIPDPNAAEYTISDLDPNRAPFYFVGTSYDEFLESDYTPEAIASKDNMTKPLAQDGFGIMPRKFKETITTETESMTTTKTMTVRTVE